MMRALPIAGICFLLWLASCSQAERIPPGVFGPERMSAILLDMRMASAYSDTYVPDTARKLLDRELRLKTFYAQILELHHTDHTRFMHSYGFYEDHPDLMQKIYQIMQDSIDRKSAYQDALIEKENRLQRERMRSWQPIRVKDYLMLYKMAADSFPPKRLRIFRPDHWQKPVPRVRPRNFMWLYKSVTDSVHHKPRRVFNPNLFN